MCREISAGESVGYGRSFIADKAMRIAILNIGYADGLRRSMGNGKGRVWIKGSFAPIIGRVCMDMCMVDVTDISGVQSGTMAEVFGQHIPLRDVARAMGTIPYEVLTGISQRVRRIYTEE
jgi:alanine racemase